MTTVPIARGLAGVIAGQTSLSDIDGEGGLLAYRGYPIEDLAGHVRHEEAACLLLDGELPDAESLAAVESGLRARELPPGVLAGLRSLPRDTHPMTVLQSFLPLLDDAAAKALPRLRSRAVQRERLLALWARLPGLLLAWLAIREGRTPAPPAPDRPLLADFLARLAGGEPDEDDVALLEAVQVLQMEHGFNASTFAVRVVASTLAPLSECLSAGVAALHGPLHGGADEAAFAMARAIGEPSRAPAWVDAALARGERIMGLGHREYRVLDPRAAVLRNMAFRLARTGEARRILEVLAAVEQAAGEHAARSGKTLRANVEFWKGAVLASLGVPPDAFTSLFVLARCIGWGAHALEVWDDHALIRPRALYVGPAPRRRT